MEQIKYFHHCTNKESAKLIKEYGTIRYLADDLFFNGSVSEVNAPKVFFLECYKYQGRDIFKTTYPRDLKVGDESYMLKFPIKKSHSKRYNYYLIEDAGATEEVKHHKIFMVHIKNKEGLNYALLKNYRLLDINNNEYFMFNKEDKKWYTIQYTDENKVIVDIAYCGKTIFPKKSPFKMQYITGVEKRNSVFYAIHTENKEKIEYDVKEKKVFSFTIKTKLKEVNLLSGRVKKGSKENKYLSKYYKTSIKCKNGDLKQFSICFNEDAFIDIKDIEHVTKTCKLKKNKLNIYTHFNQLVILSLVYSN
ncbi:hypothetical protein DICPUDRAFT_77187 [Dictyostelium purpureum]|uniref:Uncharacterized protein n=1 Tax=Dictyostelium purpureum TaxID=5786 RepID=F0ZFV5_DICPU|nr:uncharacterized protein DICPUDRAFT_77187 [Dictyostelium purpureum]EGC37179.1 hypothetical protein DICPUDRAFT_77187 [Dictyostelium purpureum]|eukprot:XP_003286307.1 hypothetical protein DICPUDRAFT_77187 [Dictyostelium purpureum]